MLVEGPVLLAGKRLILACVRQCFLERLVEVRTEAAVERRNRGGLGRPGVG